MNNGCNHRNCENFSSAAGTPCSKCDTYDGRPECSYCEESFQTKI